MVVMVAENTSICPKYNHYLSLWVCGSAEFLGRHRMLAYILHIEHTRERARIVVHLPAAQPLSLSFRSAEQKYPLHTHLLGLRSQKPDPPPQDTQVQPPVQLSSSSSLHARPHSNDWQLIGVTINRVPSLYPPKLHQRHHQQQQHSYFSTSSISLSPVSTGVVVGLG